MAKRPVFLPILDNRPAVRVEPVEFDWHPGFSVSQKRKSIEALHEAARRELGVKDPLEISSRSPTELGRQLGAFALPVEAPDGTRSTVEAVFQGCKVFDDGGPFPELFRMSGRDARRDPRVKEEGSGERRKPCRFLYGEQAWQADGSTAFYDWLYVKALLANRDLAEELDRFDAFTDIAFNPKRSLNCQARAAAFYRVLLRRLDGDREALERTLRDIDAFRRLHAELTSDAPPATGESERDRLAEPPAGHPSAAPAEEPGSPRQGELPFAPVEPSTSPGALVRPGKPRRRPAEPRRRKRRGRV